jgi:hypothetical protein
MFREPIIFDMQDTGHGSHGPLTWDVITKYYKNRGTYSHKRYGNQLVLTGPFAGTQSNNKELVMNHYRKICDWNTVNIVKHQKKWQNP